MEKSGYNSNNQGGGWCIRIFCVCKRRNSLVTNNLMSKADY